MGFELEDVHQVHEAGVQQKDWVRHLVLEVGKTPVKTVECIVQQEKSQGRRLANSLRCKKQIKKEKLDK